MLTKKALKTKGQANVRSFVRSFVPPTNNNARVNVRIFGDELFSNRSGWIIHLCNTTNKLILWIVDFEKRFQILLKIVIQSFERFQNCNARTFQSALRISGLSVQAFFAEKKSV
jgi:hypothetical protein